MFWTRRAPFCRWWRPSRSTVCGIQPLFIQRHFFRDIAYSDGNYSNYSPWQLTYHAKNAIHNKCVYEEIFNWFSGVRKRMYCQQHNSELQRRKLDLWYVNLVENINIYENLKTVKLLAFMQLETTHTSKLWKLNELKRYC